MIMCPIFFILLMMENELLKDSNHWIQDVSLRKSKNFLNKVFSIKPFRIKDFSIQASLSISFEPISIFIRTFQSLSLHIRAGEEFWDDGKCNLWDSWIIFYLHKLSSFPYGRGPRYIFILAYQESFYSRQTWSLAHEFIIKRVKNFHH